MNRNGSYPLLLDPATMNMCEGTSTEIEQSAFGDPTGEHKTITIVIRSRLGAHGGEVRDLAERLSSVANEA